MCPSTLIWKVRSKPSGVSSSARTRAAISAAAFRLFADRGYEAVTIADVAAAAEVGRITVFRYFGERTAAVR